MALAIVLIALQAAVTLCALLLEGKDERFEGDRLIYRS
jgi:hypothetical protein